VADIEKAIKVLHDYGIKSHGMFVLGADDDDVQTVRDTVAFAIKNKIDTVHGTATAMPAAATARSAMATTTRSAATTTAATAATAAAGAAGGGQRLDEIAEHRDALVVDELAAEGWHPILGLVDGHATDQDRRVGIAGHDVELVAARRAPRRRGANVMNHCSKNGAPAKPPRRGPAPPPRPPPPEPAEVFPPRRVTPARETPPRPLASCPRAPRTASACAWST